MKSNYHGVTNKPSKSNRIVEIEYSDPLIFKKLISMIYACTKRKITMSFTNEILVMTFKDHYNKIDFLINVMGSNMISYYCRETFTVCIDAEEINGICNIIRKNFGSIVIYATDTSSLTFHLKDHPFGARDVHVATTIQGVCDQDILSKASWTYGISFRLDSSHYKKRLTTYNKKRAKFCAIEYDGRKVKFRYKTEDFASCGRTVYDNNENIKVRVYDPTQLNCLTKLEYLLNPFKTLVSTNTYFLLSNEFGVCINFYMDPIDSSKISKYKYDDNIFVGDQKNSIVMRLFIDKNI